MYGQNTVDSRNSGGRSVGVGGYDEWLTDRSWEASELILISKFSVCKFMAEARALCPAPPEFTHTDAQCIVRRGSSSTCRTKW